MRSPAQQTNTTVQVLNSESDSSSAGQKFPYPLWNHKVHCRAHKSSPTLMSLVRRATPYFSLQPGKCRIRDHAPDLNTEEVMMCYLLIAIVYFRGF
jgi:hypothetical protein